MKKKIILSIVALISLISIIINYKYSNNSLLDTSNMVAVYVDDKQTDKIPSKDSGYVLDKYECSDEAKIKWNYDSWSLVLRDFKKGTKCTYYFKKGKPVIVDNKTDEGKDKEEKIDEEKIGVVEGKKVGDLEKPTKEGYTFEGWYDESGKPLTDDMIVPLDSKLTAKWTINTYQLTINTNGGTINNSTDSIVINLKYKEKYTINNISKKGYTFKSFSADNNKTTINNNVVTMGASNTTINTNWQINTYKLTVNTNCNNSVITKEIKYNESITLEEPKCEGYTYSGYNLNSGVYENNKFTISDSDATLTYKWVANNYPYIVRHYKQTVDGQKYTLVESDTKEGQAPYNSTLTPETKNYTGFTSPAKKTITIKVDDKTYKNNKVDYNYARNKYTLTINPNGGTYNGSTSKNLYYEQTTTLNTPSKACHTFINWTASSGTITDNLFKMGLSNANLTANYQLIKYATTLNVNGGSPLSSNIINHNCGQAIGTLPTPVRSGYNFDGWYTEANGGQKVVSSTILDSNSTIFAHWTASTYTVVFNRNNATGRNGYSSSVPGSDNMPSQTINVGQKTKLTKNSYYKNDYNSQYKFLGWAEFQNGTVKYTDEQEIIDIASPGSTKVLYAKFELEYQRLNESNNVINSEVNKLQCTIDADNIDPRLRGQSFNRSNNEDSIRIETIENMEECMETGNCRYRGYPSVKINWKENKIYFEYKYEQDKIYITCDGTK